MSSQACYPDKAPKVDELLEVLSHHLRREVVDYFERCTDRSTASLGDVVAHIDRRVPGTRSDELPISLLHVHLPKLEAAGMLEYDRRTEQLRYHGHEEAERWLGEMRAVFAE